MKTITVAIEETVVQEFKVTVVCDDEEEAVKKAIDTAIAKYKNCEFVLEPGELTCKRIAAVSPRLTPWEEF